MSTNSPSTMVFTRHVSVINDMEAFDRLPKVIRDKLNYCNGRWTASPLWELIKQGLDRGEPEETIAMRVDACIKGVDIREEIHLRSSI